MKLDVTYMSSRTENYLVGEGTLKILGGEHFLFFLKKRVSETTTTTTTKSQTTPLWSTEPILMKV